MTFKYNKTQVLGSAGVALAEAETPSLSGLDVLKEWSGKAAVTALITTAVVTAADKLLGGNKKGSKVTVEVIHTHVMDASAKDVETRGQLHTKYLALAALSDKIKATCSRLNKLKKKDRTAEVDAEIVETQRQLFTLEEERKGLQAEAEVLKAATAVAPEPKQ
jgi:hypothetical protein